MRQLARSPFLCAFRSGWRRTTLCSVHIYYGKAVPNDERRIEEIKLVSAFFHKRNTDRATQPDGEPDNVVLLGDFNIFNRLKDKTIKALEQNKFVVPEPIQDLNPKTNLGASKDFDQIAFHDPNGRLKASRAGVFFFTDYIYGPDDAAAYQFEMAESAPAKFNDGKSQLKVYKQWRTFQISDHYPCGWRSELILRTPFSAAGCMETGSALPLIIPAGRMRALLSDCAALVVALSGGPYVRLWEVRDSHGP